MVNESSGLMHGIGKLHNGIDVIEGMLANAGFYARVGAWLIAVNMLFAFGLVHGGDLVAMAGGGGGLKLEAQYMFFFTAVALALLGPGRYAFNQR